MLDAMTIYPVESVSSDFLAKTLDIRYTKRYTVQDPLKREPYGAYGLEKPSAGGQWRRCSPWSVKEVVMSRSRVLFIGLVLLCLVLLSAAVGVAALGRGPARIAEERAPSVGALSPTVPVRSLNLAIVYRNAPLKPVISPTPTHTPTVTPSPTMTSTWSTLLSEDFEGPFPDTVWDLIDNSPEGDYLWGITDAKAHDGQKSAWPAVGGADGVDPKEGDYPNNLKTAMRYGPFDLSDAQQAELDFYYVLNAHEDPYSEENSDLFRWGASVDGTDFSGYQDTGDTYGWVQETFDLTDWIGESEVWIAFTFESNASVTDEGVFVDDVLLRKSVGGAGSQGAQGAKDRDEMITFRIGNPIP